MKNSKSDLNNPNNDAFWRIRGYSERPDDWKNLRNNLMESATKNIFPDDGGIDWPLTKDDY
jgi:hypothetical protein